MAEAGAMIGSPRRELKYPLRESSTTTLLRFKCKWICADCFFFFFFPQRGRKEKRPSAFCPPAAFLWHGLRQTHRRHVSSDFLMSATDGLCHARLMAILGRNRRRKKKKRKEKHMQSLTQSPQVHHETELCCAGFQASLVQAPSPAP